MYSLRIRHKGIRAAFERFPREDFIPPEFSHLKNEAKLDKPLFFGESYVMAEPSIIARMLQGLRLTGEETVLEVGAGTGFVTSMLSTLAGRVYSYEKNGDLFEFAKKRLEDENTTNVHLFWGDGGEGLQRGQNFDAILVQAASYVMPEKLLRQLKIGGHIAIPIGDVGEQRLVIAIREEGGLSEKYYEKTHYFLQLSGSQGHDYLAGQNPYRHLFRPHGDKKSRK